jgi:hypothetical protein
MVDFALGSEESAASRDGFNNRIAIAVAIISAFMAVAKVKDDNIVQTWQHAQITAVDTWNQYQAKRLRQFVLETSLAEIASIETGGDAAGREATARRFREDIERYKGEIQELATAAKAQEAIVDETGDRDDLFDLSDALLSLSVALFAITALLRTRWLFGFASVVGLGGLFFGVAGFGGWTAVHPGWLVALLS